MTRKVCFNCGDDLPVERHEFLGQLFCSEQCISDVNEDECVVAGSMSDDELNEMGIYVEEMSYMDVD